MTYSEFPKTRMRRNRSDQWVRNLVAENTLSVSDLIWPVFVIEGQNKREEVPSMPGVERLSIDLVTDKVKHAHDLGIPAIAVFPVIEPNLKTEQGDEAVNPENLLCRAVAHIKKEVPGIGIITDVALDPYTSHGHDGVIEEGYVENDKTLDILLRQALLQAKAGADVIAPSDMMDGRVIRIRKALEDHKFHTVKIMSYAAKYASSFYGPFRDAIQSGGCLQGDKKTYQMDPANSDEAMREIALDIQEGADFVIIKPGMPYLDIIRRTSSQFGIPVTAYHVSGEYAMLKHAALAGCLDYDAALKETLMAFKRAGASGILTYAALDAARILRD